ncbi:hypothetical protein RF11_00491 [Thelohanellus kitauei]|uniref:Uncharacterized protein n=1 Tax=Thelohanellus kitauei TaxID=669202 RepID=A0A0C2MMY5_THEKT|nr:hypothetical protein RF11_00491 [Thelohanellus kitauei]
MASLFDAPLPELKESLENEGMNSSTLVNLKSRNVSPSVDGPITFASLMWLEIRPFMEFLRISPNPEFAHAVPGCTLLGSELSIFFTNLILSGSISIPDVLRFYHPSSNSSIRETSDSPVELPEFL